MRRYGRFKALHQLLQIEYPEVQLPPLPQATWGRSFNPRYIEQKRSDLELYLNRVFIIFTNFILYNKVVITIKREWNDGMSRRC